MKVATIHEIKQELTANSEKILIDLCLRLARFKKENKELLTYLLFEANDLEGYINEVNALIDQEISELDPTVNLYFTKKSLRKIVRIANKHIRYTGSKQVEVAILLHFCKQLNKSGIPFKKSTLLINLYQQQLKKIKAALATMHEDLQYDYLRELASL